MGNSEPPNFLYSPKIENIFLQFVSEDSEVTEFQTVDTQAEIQKLVEKFIQTTQKNILGSELRNSEIRCQINFEKKKAGKSLPIFFVPAPQSEKRTTIELKPHQVFALKKFSKWKENRMLLFHGMGTGKTLASVSIALNEINSGRVRYAFFVAPKSLVQNF